MKNDFEERIKTNTNFITTRLICILHNYYNDTMEDPNVINKN